MFFFRFVFYEQHLYIETRRISSTLVSEFGTIQYDCSVTDSNSSTVVVGAKCLQQQKQLQLKDRFELKNIRFISHSNSIPHAADKQACRAAHWRQQQHHHHHNQPSIVPATIPGSQAFAVGVPYTLLSIFCFLSSKVNEYELL